MSQTCKIEFSGGNSNKKVAQTYNIFLFLTDKCEEYQKIQSKNEKGDTIYKASPPRGSTTPHGLIAHNPNNILKINMDELNNNNNAIINMFIVADPEISGYNPVQGLIDQTSNLEYPKAPLFNTTDDKYYQKLSSELLNLSKIIVNVPSGVTMNIYDATCTPVGLSASEAKGATVSLNAVHTQDNETKTKMLNCLESTLTAYSDPTKSTPKILHDRLNKLKQGIQRNFKDHANNNTRIYGIIGDSKNEANISINAKEVPLITYSNIKTNTNKNNDLSVSLNVNNSGPRFGFTTSLPDEKNAALINTSFKHNDLGVGESTAKTLAKLAVILEAKKENALNLPHHSSNKLCKLYNAAVSKQDQLAEFEDNRALWTPRPKSNIGVAAEHAKTKYTQQKPMYLTTPSILSKNYSQLQNLYHHYFNTHTPTS